MSCSTSTAPCVAARAVAGAARAMIVRDRVARRRELRRDPACCPLKRRADEVGDRRMADGLDVVPAERAVVEPQHLPRGLVGQLQPSLRIDDDDAFDHAGEDRLHPRAVARLLVEPSPELLHRLVQRPRDGAQFVVAEVQPRRRQIALPVARARRRRWRCTRCADAAAETDRRSAPAPTSARPSAVSVAVSDRAQLLADVGERQRDADEGDRPDDCTGTAM